MLGIDLYLIAGLGTATRIFELRQTRRLPPITEYVYHLLRPQRLPLSAIAAACFAFALLALDVLHFLFTVSPFFLPQHNSIVLATVSAKHRD